MLQILLNVTRKIYFESFVVFKVTDFILTLTIISNVGFYMGSLASFEKE